jgi:outer membrane biosynthesis protein TonB
MGYFDTKDKKRGLVGTVGVHLLILVLFAIYGLTYPDPLPESGIPINFGTSDVGSGEIAPETPGSPPPEVSQAGPQPSHNEEVVTQEHIETIQTPPAEENTPVKPKEDVKPKDTKPKETTKPKEEPKPKIDSKLQDALNNAFNKPGQSQGNDKNQEGNKGQRDGQGGNAYTGKSGGGGGGDGNYRLGNRNPLAKILPKYECEEYGTVVMLIKVNRNGKTIDAKLQIKGTTNTAACLVNRAKEAALKTNWEGDPTAPAVQVGTITYHFELN